MTGVRFTKPMAPYSERDTALLPEAVARQMIAEGAAEPYRFPDRPFATEAGEPSPAPSLTLSPEPPTARRGGSYRTKA